MARRTLARLSARDTTIVGVVGRRVWTAAGAPALEAELRLACGTVGRAIASPASGIWQPVPAPLAQGIALDDAPATNVTPIRGTRPDHSAVAPARAVAAVNGLLAAALHGVDAGSQEDVDATLFKLDTGGDPWVARAARTACSLAAAHAAARAAEAPLYRYLRAGTPARMPLPAVDIVADQSGTSPFRALILLPFSADGVDDALALSLAIHRDVAAALGPAPVVDERALERLFFAIERAGFLPAEEVGVAVDVGAGRLYRDGHYHCGGKAYDTDGWGERLSRLVDDYPVASLEDPFAELASLATFTPAVDERARVVGNQLFASDAERIGAAAAEGLASGVVLRPEAAGTLSELRVAFDAARLAAWPVFLTGDAGIEDTTLVHIATAWQSGYIKLGGVGRGSLARWNELIRIEAQLRPGPAVMHIERAARLVH
jgi:enolase